MEILLDTTVQIERIFKRKRKAEIEKTITSNNCGSSTYVFGEFKRSIVKDFVTLYNIMQIEEDLAGVRDHINDTVFHRSFQRIYYIFNDLCKLYNDDYELIKEELSFYPKRLERRFYYGLKSPLMNETDCHRAKAQVIFTSENALIQGVECSKKDNFCNSCNFWEKYKHFISGLEYKDSLQKDFKTILCKVLNGEEPLKGNICKRMGDCIIALEALQTDGKKVCTTNKKDFEPICEHIGVKLCE